MNTPSRTVQSQSRVEVTAAAGVSPMSRLYWTVRREVWENRSIYVAPLAASAVFLLGFFIGLIHLPDRMRAALALAPMRQHEAIEQPYVFVAILLMAVYLVVAVIYCLDALYGERRDRSVLFWKSLPVSDLTTVLSKASIPILVLPLVTFAITVVMQLIMLLVSSAVLAGAGMSAAPLWAHVSFFKTTGINFYHLVLFHGFWYAPLYGWLLMVSAWAKRAPFLWAALPPAAIGALEKLAFNTSHFATMLQYRFLGGPSQAPEGGMTMEMMAPHHLAHYLTGPGLWAGLILAAAFLAAAVRLRRSCGPI